MNSEEILGQSRKGVQLIQQKIMEYLTPIAQKKEAGLVAMVPAVLQKEHEVTNIGLLRFGGAKVMSTYALGYSDPKFLDIWRELFPPVVLEPNSPVKTHEFEVMKNFFMGVTDEFKALGVNIDPKKIFVQEKYGFKEDARFMVVDDSLVSRKHSRSCLAMAGYFNIEECPDGQVALNKNVVGIVDIG